MQLPSLAAAATITALQAAAIAANSVGTVIDLQGYKGPVSFVQTTAPGTGTTPTLDGRIQTSPDNSAWSNVANGAFTQVANTAGVQVLAFDVKDLSRYNRCVSNVGGTTPVIPMTVLAIGQKERI